MEPKWRNEGREFTRSKVRERDNHTCQKCRKKWEEGQRRFDVHHLNGLCGKKSVGYDKISEINGLITLCHKCHYHRHDFNGYNGLWKVKKTLADERKIKIMKLKKENMTNTKIAKILGITQQRVSQVLIGIINDYFVGLK